MLALRSFDTFRDSYEQVLVAISSPHQHRGPGGVFLGIRGEGPPLVLQILTLFQIKKTFHFPCRFETWRLRSITVFRPGAGRNYVTITWIRTPTKRFLKILVELAYYFLFMINLELKRQIRSSILVFPRKPYPNSDQTKLGKVYTRFQTPDGAKTRPFGAAHTSKANIRKYPPALPHR